MKNQKSFVEEETSNLDSLNPVRETVMTFAKLVYRRVHGLIKQQCEDILQYGENFHNWEEMKKELEDEVNRLEHISQTEVPKFRTLDNEVKRLEYRCREYEEKVRHGHQLTEKEMEKVREVVSRLTELRPEHERLNAYLNSFGRLGIAHVNIQLAVARKALKKHLEIKRCKVFNMEPERFVSIYENPNEVEEIANAIQNAFIGMTKGLYQKAGRCIQEQYVAEIFLAMKPEDIQYRPFQYVDKSEKCMTEEGIDASKMNPEVIRRCFYDIVANAVRKFARIPLQRMCEKMDTFQNFSEFEEGFVAKTF